MEKTLEIHLAEQARKFIDAIEKAFLTSPRRDDMDIGFNVGLRRAVDIIGKYQMTLDEKINELVAVYGNTYSMSCPKCNDVALEGTREQLLASLAQHKNECSK